MSHPTNALHRHANGREHHGRVKSGLYAIPLIDGRKPVARAYARLTNQIIKDLGGDSEIATIKLELIKRFASCVCTVTALENKFANGERVDVGEYALLASTMIRTARELGLERVAKTITPPDLSTYLSQRARNVDACKVEADDS
jgi:hypothetical protein